jgi:hypothetical protein
MVTTRSTDTFLNGIRNRFGQTVYGKPKKKTKPKKKKK